ncbi:snRNA activating protein complex subunit 4 [Echinococcus multilocularis]|uniref:snRNA activating protein complex subunit 4 n=1 Tax=Echinococcus multilocularis TaxID=6211 RepID=A0A0S4MKS5_ECHMU|nr:snRNA activating protein complex subunit 4 [Echinococcus multilocularis]
MGDNAFPFVVGRISYTRSSVEWRRNSLHVRLERGDLDIKSMSPNLATISTLAELSAKRSELHKMAVLLEFQSYRRLKRGRPDAAALMSSSKHRIFGLRCFAPSLWPCLLASMRARDNADQPCQHRISAQLRRHLLAILPSSPGNLTKYAVSVQWRTALSDE